MPDDLSDVQNTWNSVNDALTNFFMDNSVPPEVTIARLLELKNECARLAQFIKNENPSLIRPPEQSNDAETGIRSACPYERHAYYIIFLSYKYCPYCARALHS